MSVINTNVNAIIARNAGAVNERSMTKAMQQLSTGKRINVAADDAAGLAISTKMTSQVRGLDQAVRNANDGISMLQVLEGATVEMTNMLQRMRELAVQSSNDTNTSTERSYLNDEFVQLRQEINRIANNTQWNGVDLMNGGGAIGTAFDTADLTVNGADANADLGGRVVKFQVGANSNQTIDFQVGSFLIEAGTAGGGAGTSATSTTETLNLGPAIASGELGNYSEMTLDDGDNSYTIDLTAVTGLLGQTSATSATDQTAIAAALQTAIQGNADLADLTVSSGGNNTYTIEDPAGTDWTVSFTLAAADITDNVSVTDQRTIDGTTTANTAVVADFGDLDSTKVGDITFDVGGNTITLSNGAAANWTTVASNLQTELRATAGYEQSTVTKLQDGQLQISFAASQSGVSEDAGAVVTDYNTIDATNYTTADQSYLVDLGGVAPADLTSFSFTGGGSDHTVDLSTLGAITSTATLASELQGYIQTLSGFEATTVVAIGSDLRIDFADADGAVTGTAISFEKDAGSSAEVAIDAGSMTFASKDGVSDPLYGAGIAVTEVLGEPAAAGAAGVATSTGVFTDADLANSAIDTTVSAQDAVGALDTALQSLNEQRSAIGATINRLNYAADNLTNTSANVTAARSRVLDTDYAAATTELARTQIIQQASTAMLAQANQGAQSVLSLLK